MTPTEHANSSAPTAFAPSPANLHSTRRRSTALASRSAHSLQENGRAAQSVFSAATRANPARGSPPRSPQACARRARRSKARAWSPRPRSHFSRARTASTQASSSLLRTIPGVTTASSSSAAMASSCPMRWSWPWKRRFCIHAAQAQISDPHSLPARRRQSRLPGRLHPVPHRLRSGPFACRPEDRRRLRQRRCCGDRAGTFPPPQWWLQRRHHAAQHRARRPQHQRQLRRAASRVCARER